MQKVEFSKFWPLAKNIHFPPSSLYNIQSSFEDEIEAIDHKKDAPHVGNSKSAPLKQGKSRMVCYFSNHCIFGILAISAIGPWISPVNPLRADLIFLEVKNICWWKCIVMDPESYQKYDFWFWHPFIVRYGLIHFGSIWIH